MEKFKLYYCKTLSLNLPYLDMYIYEQRENKYQKFFLCQTELICLGPSDSKRITFN